MTEPTYNVFRLTRESPKQLTFINLHLSFLNNDRMSVKWFKASLAYSLRKHPILGGMKFKQLL